MGKKHTPPKPANVSVHVEFEDGHHPTSARVSKSGDIVFFDENGMEIRPRKMERTMSHDRRKGPKIRTWQPLGDGECAFSGLQQLAEFEAIFAIDTNYSEVGGERISVTGFIPFSLEPFEGRYRLSIHENHVQLYEFVGATANPELLAIHKLTADLAQHVGLGRERRFAIVTDTELGSLDAFNAREKPIFEGRVLPDGFTLLYASSDTGWEVLNKFIRLCDKAAEQTIKERRAGDIPSASWAPMEDFPKIKFRFSHRNARVTIENSTLADLEIHTGQSISLYGRPRKS